MNLESIQQEFSVSGLSIQDLNTDPFYQFEKWFQQTIDADLPMQNAMSLATVSKEGQPSLRTVLLKYFDHKGFVFYTNYQSRKAQEISQNPKVALLFYWQALERQIKITGTASKVSAKESLSYFLSRPKGSQIGAWCSNQSEIISSRQLLRSKYEEFKQKFKDKKVPLPSFWGGYRIVPETFEFWLGQQHRLHDSFRYSKTDEGSWRIDRLAP